jgi:hypothetical protein
MNNLNVSISFIALNKLKHEAYNMSCHQVELKLTDFTLLDAHTLPIHGTPWRVCVCGPPSMCVCHIITWDKTRMTIKVLFSLHISLFKPVLNPRPVTVLLEHTTVIIIQTEK